MKCFRGNISWKALQHYVGDETRVVYGQGAPAVPLGGGFQRHFTWGKQKTNFSTRFFENVIRPTEGTECDLRFMLEFVWD